MRIIAGERRGAQLFAPRGMDTRPTQAKVRESVFNIIQAYVPGAQVLDLFAGSGALALESISRGAAFAALADVDRDAVSCIRRNVEKLRFQDRTRLYACDWHQAVGQMQTDNCRFDLVFLDPPYRLRELAECCHVLADKGLLLPDCLLVLEHATDVPLALDGRFSLWKQRAYGDTELHFYLYTGNEAREEVDA